MNLKKKTLEMCECKQKIFELQEKGLNDCVRFYFNAISIAFYK